MAPSTAYRGMSSLYLWATLGTVLLQYAQLAAGCGVWGQVYCDTCGEGSYTSGKDSYLNGISVKANCTVVKGTSTSYFIATDTTDSSGKFEATLQSGSNLFGKANAEAAFLYALFLNSDFRSGRTTDGYVAGCSISISNAPASCSKLTVNNGACASNGNAGNGWFASGDLGLKQYQNTAAADIYLGAGGKLTDSVCLSPSTRPATCPTPGGTGDPHFSGADGSHFDFSGEPDAHFCLLSDAHIHVNAYYGGRYGQYESNPHKALTWIRQLGIMWGHHTITLAAREGARWQYDSGYMARMEVDGVEVVLGQAGDSALFADEAVELKWLAAKVQSADDLVDIYQLKIRGVLTLRLTLRPEVAALRTSDDGIVHFDFELPQVDVSNSAHGILGQTFRADHRHKLAEQSLKYSSLLHTDVVPGDNGEGFLDGSVADYRATGLLRPDCAVARFARASSRDPETAQAVELAFGGAVSTLGRNRKMLKSAVAAS